MMCKWMLSLTLAFLTTLHVGAEYRDFMDTQGRAIRGKVLRYQASSGTVTMERSNKKIARVPITVFSEKDQAYILEWKAGQTFTDKNAFRISAKRESVPNEPESREHYPWSYKVEDKTYAIRLENLSAVDMEGVSVEYCIFYEQEIIVGNKSTPKLGVKYGKIDFGSIPKQSEKELSTAVVKIYKAQLDSDWTRGRGDGAVMDNVQKGKVHGIWLRAHTKGKAGTSFTREYCLPDSLRNSRGWTTRSIGAGKN